MPDWPKAPRDRSESKQLLGRRRVGLAEYEEDDGARVDDAVVTCVRRLLCGYAEDRATGDKEIEDVNDDEGATGI